MAGAGRDRGGRLVGAQRGAPGRHHVAAIGEEGDATESLGLALGKQRVAAAKQAFEPRVAFGNDAHPRLQDAGPGDAVDSQAVSVVPIAIRRQRVVLTCVVAGSVKLAAIQPDACVVFSCV